MVRSTQALLLAFAVITGAAVRADDAANAAARGVMDAFMAAFNAKDGVAWADTLLYPHVRFASGKVTTFPDRAAFMAANHIDALIAGEGWDHSKWDSMQIVQSSPTKVHIAVEFSRYHKDGTQYASYPSLYIVEQVDGHWGIRARSSFAP
ncbi:MAG TPA: hypothetical protein VL379_20655 [Pseudomonadales bacterium]|jgi:hypothetical protein|nr:hypothetical protein [Pseudomonadales bacterium]